MASSKKGLAIGGATLIGIGGVIGTSMFLNSSAAPDEKAAEQNTGQASEADSGLIGVSDNPYGTTRLKVELDGKKIVNIDVLEVPDHKKSQKINKHAMPILIEETLKKQSLDVSDISGATFTVKAFKKAMHDALDGKGII